MAIPIQDTLDELLPFVAKYVDHASVWSDFETGVHSQCSTL